MHKIIKRIPAFFVYLCIFLILVQNNVYGEKIESINANDIYAKSAILIDAESKRVLYEKNAYEQMPMASTTKIMTCLVALENSEPDTEVVFSKYASSMPKVKLGAACGTKFKMEDMLYSLMLESHNDTAVAIAEAVGGTVQNFASMMNDRAKKIGVKNTNFVTPNGLDDPLHYTTSYDLAIIAAEAIKNEEFLAIINTRAHSFNEISGQKNYQVNNKDAFLEMMEGAIGIKTGFTGNAGYCFVGAIRRQNKTLISVVLASGWPPSKTYKWKDTVKLMKYGINNFEYKVIFDGIKEYKTVSIKNGVEKSVKTYIPGELSMLISDKDMVEYKYDIGIDTCIDAPVKKNEVLGYMRIYINGEEFSKYRILASKSVKKIDFKYSLSIVLKAFLFG